MLISTQGQSRSSKDKTFHILHGGNCLDWVWFVWWELSELGVFCVRGIVSTRCALYWGTFSTKMCFIRGTC